MGLTHGQAPVMAVHAVTIMATVIYIALAWWVTIKAKVLVHPDM